MLTKSMVRDYHPTFCKEALLLASSILENPNALDKHIERSSASATMSILYDYPTLEHEHDKTLMEIHEFIDRMSAASAPGAYLVELFPWMIHIPERYTFALSSPLKGLCDRTSDAQNGKGKDWNIFGSIQPCSRDLSIPFAMIL
jgi:hypothetical protein